MLTNIDSKSRSTVIKKACPFCSKTAQTVHEEIDGPDVVTKLACGHTIITPAEAIDSTWTHKSISGKVPFTYQYETVERAERAAFRTIFNHDTGTGKTVCSLLTIKKHPEKLLPFAVFCKKSLQVQWFKEIVDWLGLPAQIIDSGKDKPYPELFKAFIISYDTVKNLDWISKIGLKLAILDECQQIKNPQAKRTQAIRLALSGKIKRQRTFSSNLPKREHIKVIALNLMAYHGISGRFKLNFEELPDDKLGLCECRAGGEGIITGQITISRNHAEHDTENDVIETILHEIAHAITPGAGHRAIWSDTAKQIGSNGNAFAACNGSESFSEGFDFPAVPHIICMSATPIKNHYGEYFPALNLTRPDIFFSQANYEREFCDTYQTSAGYYKIGGLKNAGEHFKELTNSWIIGYKREDVLPDLPKIFRKYFYIELGDEVKKAYIEAMKAFRKEYEESEERSGFAEQTNLMAKLAILRQITGLAKILPVTEFVEEFLEANGGNKIVLFVNHKSVGMGLYNNIFKITEKLGLQAPMRLTSENAGSPEGNRIDEAFKTDPKALVLIASTLSAGEGKNWQVCQDAVIVERQWNPANEEQAEGRFPRPGSIAESISVTYPTALGTPDEYLMEVVEYKRSILKNEKFSWNQNEVMKDMLDKLYKKGGERWHLS